MYEYVIKVGVSFWSTLLEMSPYLLFGFLVAGILSVLVTQRFVERHLGGKGIWPLVKSTIFGIPLPLCSCGVIPVSMSLHKHGASKGASVAFLLATPQTGVDSILVTFSLMGTAFAIYRPLAALATGLIGGLLVNWLAVTEREHLEKPIKCEDECCKLATGRAKLLNGLRYGFVTLPRDIGKSMLIGLAIAALITALVPQGFFADKIGTGIVSMLVMMLIGIPMYVCASASVPIAAALIHAGISPGAALVFLMTGPATNAAALATIWQALGHKTAIVYLLSVAGCALGAGLLLDFIGTKTPVVIMAHGHAMLPDWFKIISAALLIGILAYGTIKAGKKKHCNG